MSKNINVPKLRFKEFTKGWEEKKLFSLSENGFSNGAFNDPKKVGSGYKIINVKDMYIDGVINTDTLTRVALDEKEFLKNRVEYGDIFFTRSSLVKEGIAYSNISLSTDKDLTFDGHLIRMRPKKEICFPIFLYYTFTTKKVRNQFIVRGKTTTMTTIGQDDIASVNIFLPLKQEQEKIALFLSNVDTKIEQLIKKDELLQQYKKSIMQKIFNQEIIFKDNDGNEFKKWEEKRLKNLCDVIKGEQLNRDNLTEIGDYPAINGGINPSGFTDKYNTLLNTITISEGGNSCGYVNLIKTNFWSGGHNYSLQNLKKNIENIYLFQYLKYNENSIMNLRVGSGLPNIQKSDIVNFRILLPCIEEQNKIANFLSSIDDKIEENQKILEKTKEFKKSLLQQMFV